MSRWWRAYDEALHDPKLIALPDRLFRAWFNLLCIASKHGGVLPAMATVAIELRVSANPAARSMHPEWWIDAVRHAYPHSWEAILAEGNRHPPMGLRVNRRRSSIDAYQARMEAEGLHARRAGECALALEQPVRVERLPGFAAGEVSVHVIDCGEGIPAAFQPQVFQRFAQPLPARGVARSASWPRDRAAPERIRGRKRAPDLGASRPPRPPARRLQPRPHSPASSASQLDNKPVS